MSKMKGARTYRASNHIMVRFWCGIFFILKCNGINGTFVTGPRIKIDSTTTLLSALANI